MLVGGLLWMSGDSLLLPGWNLLGMGSLAKGELNVWVARTGS